MTFPQQWTMNTIVNVFQNFNLFFDVMIPIISAGGCLVSKYIDLHCSKNARGPIRPSIWWSVILVPCVYAKEVYIKFAHFPLVGEHCPSTTWPLLMETEGFNFGCFPGSRLCLLRPDNPQHRSSIGEVVNPPPFWSIQGSLCQDKHRDKSPGPSFRNLTKAPTFRPPTEKSGLPHFSQTCSPSDRHCLEILLLTKYRHSRIQ